MYPNVRSNTCSKEHSSNIKIVFFVAQEALCDSAVADKAFNFHVVNGWDGQSDTAARLEHTLSTTPQKPTVTLRPNTRFLLNDIRFGGVHSLAKVY